MIPQISQAPGVVQLVLNFLQALEQQGLQVIPPRIMPTG